MSQKDIYKVDNYFIKLGWIFLIVSAISILADPRSYNDLSIGKDNSYHFEDFNGRTLTQVKEDNADSSVTVNGFPLKRVIFGVNGLILLGIGLYYRSLERKIINLWDALDHTGEAKVKDLTMSLGYSRQFIIRHLKDINAQRNTYYVHDVQQDAIVDGKLMTEFLVVADCPGCGNNINERVSLNFSSPPKCKYCGTTVPVEYLNKAKQDVLTSRKDAVLPTPKKEFSIGVFVALMIFFWPAAIFYILYKKGIFTSVIAQTA